MQDRSVTQRLQKGFTLIELMITVAIIGILAAIAVPAYSDFTVRSRLAEVLGSMSACKLAAADFYLSNAGWDNDGNNISTFGLCDGVATRYLVADGVTIGAAGVISAQTQNLGGDPADAVLTMRPTIVGRQITGWVCGDPADGTTLLPRYKPGSCQG